MGNLTKAVLFFISAFFIHWNELIAQLWTSPKHYMCYEAAAQINVDGHDSEDAWQNVPWTDHFVDIEGADKPSPLFQTKVKLLWDKQYLYVFAQIQEPHVWANITQRDAVIFHDNDFEVFIDPDGDTHGYFEFEINAFNTVWDLLLPKPYRDGGPAIDDWNFEGLKTAVSIEGTINNPGDRDKGWNIEIAFPLKAFMIYCATGMPREGDLWRINFSRVEWRTTIHDGKYLKAIDPSSGKPYAEYNWVWSPQGVVNMHLPENWGYLQFVTSINDKKNIPFILPGEEGVKAELRKIYYAQQKYLSQNKRYATSLDELKELSIDSKYRPEIKTTQTLFEATAFIPGSGWMWHIDHSGRTWKSRMES